MTCPTCGAPVKDGNSFCQTCGARINNEQSSFNQQTNQNQQYNQNGYNQNQQYNQNGYNQNQQYNAGGFHPRAPITERNIVTCIILSIITCGIYSIIWYISLVDDLNLAADEPGTTSGGMVFLLGLVTCNIYTYYWMYKAGDLMNTAKYKRGLPTDSNSGILYLALSFFGLGIVAYCLIQNDLNRMSTM